MSCFFAIRAYLSGRRDPSPRVECPICKSTKIKPFEWKEISGKMVMQWKCNKCKAVYIPKGKKTS